MITTKQLNDLMNFIREAFPYFLEDQKLFEHRKVKFINILKEEIRERKTIKDIKTNAPKSMLGRIPTA